LKCKKYFYKKIDLPNNQTAFEIIFIYSLAQCDLNKILEENKNKKIDFSENKVISFLW
jgi:hypothetical protein